jgi:sulfite exporter TauE/SafE
MERLIDPAIADLQTEFADAQRQGAVWTARWALIHGVFSVAKVLAYAVAGEGIRGVSDWSRGEAVILRRTSVVFAAATILPTMLLTYA